MLIKYPKLNVFILILQYYQSELKILLGNPQKVDQKFKDILEQRESRKHTVDVKVLLPDGKKTWMNIDQYLMEK